MTAIVPGSKWADEPPWPEDAPAAPAPAPVPSPDRPRLEAVGPTTYRYVDGRLTLTFRDVRTDGELKADVAILVDGEHLLRTTSTLTLAAREKLAKVAADLAKLDGGLARRTVFAAVEAVLGAEERLAGGTDLRTASIDPPAGGLWVAQPLWPVGPLLLVAPGEAGKSTIARAIGVALATGMEIIPGIRPIGPPRAVLIVAGEDPAAVWHARSIEAICRGAEIDRRELPALIELFDARGRPLHRIARAVAERAADLDAAVVLDSMQALLPAVDALGSARDRDSLFWTAVEMIDRPVLVVGHPNRGDAKNWESADDGRAAGTEVNRDRARMVWRASWRDKEAAVGTSYRLYRLANRKANNVWRQPDLWFAAAWEFGFGGDPGVLRFLPVEPEAEDTVRPEYAAVLHLWREGVTSPKAIAEALGIPLGTAKSRTAALRKRGLIDG